MVQGDVINVGIVMGGISPEHDVSNQSGLGMLSQIDRRKFHPFPIIITLQNQWLWPADKIPPQGEFTLSDIQAAEKSLPPGWEAAGFPELSAFPHCDIMLLALHGKGGEDGSLQKVLDEKGQVYSGSGARGSADAMDKIISKEIFESHNIPTPRWEILSDFSEQGLQTLIEKLGLPLVLKIPEGGSSIGVDIAHTREDLARIAGDFKNDSANLLVEEFVDGNEATCGFVENAPRLIPTEIVPKSDEFFNYEAKYDPMRTDEITPARFSEEVLKEMQDLAEKCHTVLGLSVYSRTDFFLKNGQLYVIEVNSLPGFTANSLLPKGAAAAGLEFKDLLTKIIEESLDKKK